MRKLLLLLLLISPLGWTKTLLVMGDSLSAGYGLKAEQSWVRLLSDKVQTEAADWQVVNASISGETTAGGLRRLPALLAKHKPELVLIELGGNDGLRGYPIATMKQNLAKMVGLSQAAGADAMVMEIWLPPNYGPRYLDSFKAAFKEVAEEKQARWLPFFGRDIDLGDGMLQADGIHPTAQAQPLLMEAVWQDIKDSLQ
ncbi:arylesterase [Gallaecimonas xiamenensis]|uniref:Arylesterase n=1 Tax=Gallaecimonas xiamenensis 3-C-1 TaxID=745411 RepID=K2K092_9GAMM|nr:arylesterase [Gallaecimonas xiamenensis]EKE76119.1 Arylesterase precursor [Gallaecimonas xiamenensis 3-C-1]